MFPVKNVDPRCSLLLCVSLLSRKTLATYHCSLGFICWLRVWAFCLLLCILFCSLRCFLRFMSASVFNWVPRYLHSFQVSSSALFILYSSVFRWLIFGPCLFSMSGIGYLYSSASKLPQATKEGFAYCEIWLYSIMRKDDYYPYKFILVSIKCPPQRRDHSNPFLYYLTSNLI